VDAPRPEPPARGTLWAVASGSFGTALAQSSVVAAGPALAARFGVGPSSSGWIAAAYSVTAAAFVLAGGRAGDAVGLGTTYRAGLGLFALGAALGAVSPTLCLVVAARALQGTGAALLMGTSPALVIAGLPPERRGRATGVQLALTYAGLAAGPFVGTLLARASVPALLALPLAPLVLPCVTLGTRGPDAVPSAQRPSARATALTAGAVAAFVLAARFAAQRAWIAAGLGALVSAGAALALRSRARELLPSLSRDVVRGTVGVLLVHLATAAVSASLPFALQDRKATEVAAILSVQPLAMAIAALAAGPIVDRIGARPLLRAGAGLGALAALGLGAARGPWMPVALAALGAGAGAFVPANQVSVLAATATPERGRAGGLLATARNAGLASGVLVGTLAAERSALSAVTLTGAAALVLAALTASRRSPASAR
jgi:MFS family permease